SSEDAALPPAAGDTAGVASTAASASAPTPAGASSSSSSSSPGQQAVPQEVPFAPVGISAATPPADPAIVLALPGPPSTATAAGATAGAPAAENDSTSSNGLLQLL